MLKRFRDSILFFAGQHGIVVLLAGLIIGITISGQAPTLLSLLASSATSTLERDTVVFLSPLLAEDEEVQVGDSVDVAIRIHARTPINAAGITLSFPPEKFSVLGISKEDSLFDLWTEETRINDEMGEIHFSGGTLSKEGFKGSGLLLTVSLEARSEGAGEIVIKEANVLAHDGRGTTVDTTTRSLTLSVTQKTALSGALSMSAPSPAKPPSADLNNDGRVSLADLSILAVQSVAGYNPRYDLDQNGSLGLSDFSVLLAHMRD